MITKATLEVPNESALVPIIRHMAIYPLRELGVTEDDIGRVATIITEACSNVCKYAYEGRGEYRVELEYHAERVAITVTDHGRGFDQAKIESPKPGQIGGYGLSLIKEHSDHLEIISARGQGTRIVAEVSLTHRDAEHLDQARKLDRRELA